MRITFTCGAGTYVNIFHSKGLMSVLLPNGMQCPASDLIALAEEEELKAQNALVRAARMRVAAAGVP